MAGVARRRSVHADGTNPANVVDLGRRFTDVRVLRTGSRFTTYGARETEANRFVAIKAPNEGSASWLHEQLDNEATVLANAGGHPHIVTLYQRLSLPDGRPALLLERCAGSLESTFRGEQKMSLQEAAALGIKVAGALETVHRSGAIHGDVRPRNVLVSEWGEPVLASFDEAVRVGETDSHPLHVTTPHTAPEVLEGNTPTATSDVYGLASTLYELVAGRAAFREYAGESSAAVIVRVLSTPVRPIVAPGVPLDLSDVLTWAMTADPARRPPTPAWLAEELGRIETRQGWPRTRMIVG
jgi:serine/threonine protein kinase